MICSYPWMGALTQRFGSRKVSAGGAFLAFAATLSFLYLASHGLVVAVLACALFLRGVGLSAVGIPLFRPHTLRSKSVTCRWQQPLSTSCSVLEDRR